MGLRAKSRSFGGGFLKLVNVLRNHLGYYPTPTNLFYIWGVGSILGILLVVQILTGVLLAMHYIPHVEEAFASVERIMREISGGWLLRYLHANGSSFLFILLYIHVARGLFFQGYRKPKQWVWVTGSILFILMAGISFLGYTLPWGQMSFRGATVITNLLTALPFIGPKLVIWVWGGFAINQNTSNRFFSLHYILSIIALALSLLHSILLHLVGSISPSINEVELDLTKFFPLFVFKDLVTLVVFLFILTVIVLYKPNLFGHPDNYIRANPLITPAHIVPEWYFSPFYAMLKAFPNKAAGAAAMLLSMLLLVTLPWVDGTVTGLGGVFADQWYKIGFSVAFGFLVLSVILLGWLGSLAVTEINQSWMQIGTGVYFGYFLLGIPAFIWKEWVVLIEVRKAFQL